MFSYLSVFVCLVLYAALAACGAPAEKKPDILATVGDEPITLSEFKTFSDAIPDGMKKGQTPLEKERQVLESLIDKKLLIKEASSLPLAEDPAFKDELAAYERNRLLELYTKRAVVDPIDITPEELEAHFRATNRHRALRFSGIMLESLEEAHEVIAEVAAGADFMELAKGRSLHRESGDQGGDVGRYRIKDEIQPPIAQAIFHLQVGEVSEPVPLPFEGKRRYAIFQVTDEVPAPLSASERTVRQEVFREKRVARYHVLLDSLKAAYAPRVHGDQIRWLNEYSAQVTDDLVYPPADRAEQPICSFRQGHISLDEFLRDARAIRMGSSELVDSTRVADLLIEAVLPPHLFASEAQAAGLDQHPSLLQRVETKRLDLLLNKLREHAVDDGIDATEEEARAFYDAHPEKFMTLKTTKIIEILVASDSLARRLKAEILAGADPEPLATAHTLRQGADHHGGHLELNIITQTFYRDIFDQAEEAEVGQVVGPLRVPGGYSVFKVLERHQELKPYNAESRRRSIAYVKIDKSKHGYVRYVRGLRDKYPVQVFEDAFKNAVAATD